MASSTSGAATSSPLRRTDLRDAGPGRLHLLLEARRGHRHPLQPGREQDAARGSRHPLLRLFRLARAEARLRGRQLAPGRRSAHDRLLEELEPLHGRQPVGHGPEERGAAAGFFLVEDLLPQTIGEFSVTSCQQAVKLLSKQDQAGRNKASDAAYELGAQLLAARFNLAAGAETCSAVQQAVLDGQTLLDGINFTGSGDDLGSKSRIRGARRRSRSR